MYLSSLTLLALIASAPTTWARKKDEAVQLSKVKSLTLRNGQETSHRRVKAVPQLNCVGGNAAGLYTVDVMRCTNSGSEYDAEDIQWTCKADLPPEFKLGSTEVICEGYASSDDPFVLKGSCGVEYRLILTDAGENKYRHWVDHRAGKTHSTRYGEKKGLSDQLTTIIFWIIFAGVVGVILYSVFFPNRNNRTGRPNAGMRRGYGGGGGGGGGDDGYDDPPPPYTARAPPKSKTRSSSSRNSQQWQPGFWTGAATGAAAGYGAGAWNANRRQQAAQAGPSTFGAGPSNYRGGSSSSSPPAPSSSRQQSTGFGGTTRR